MMTMTRKSASKRGPAERRKAGTGRERGLTLLEVMVAVTLFAVLFVGVWQFSGVFVDSLRSNQVAADVDFAMHRTFERVSEELKESGVDDSGTDRVTSHPITATTVLPSITFQRRVDFTGVPADDWSTPITYALAASPGEIPTNAIDDDDDGLVDEQQLVRVQDGATEILATNVMQLTFSRPIGEYRIDFQMTIRRSVRLDTQFLTRVLSGTVGLRNKE